MTVAHRLSMLIFRRKQRTVALAAAMMLVLLTAFLLPLQGCADRRTQVPDDQILSGLRNDTKPEAIKNALVGVDSRLKQGKSIDIWAPELVRLSKHPDVSIRHAVADLMAHDPSRTEFRAALHQMLDTDTLFVCNAAALSLAAFDDSYGHELITAMLKPAVITAPRPGHVQSIAKTGNAVNHGDAIVRINASGQETVVFSPVSGKLRLEADTGDIVSGGARVAVVDPSPEQIGIALKALQKVGKSQDLHYIADIENDSDLPGSVREQAQLAHQRILERAK